MNGILTINSNGCFLDEGSFSGCISLVKIQGSDKLTFIPKYAFKDCISLTMINASNASYIDVNAFENVPTLWDSPDNPDFDSTKLICKSDVIKHIKSENPYQIWYYEGDVPPTPKSGPILRFGTKTDDYNGTLTYEQVEAEFPYHRYKDDEGVYHTLTRYDQFKVIFGENITKIGDNAFSDCHNMNLVTNVDVIPNYGLNSFKNCFSLTDIDVCKGCSIPDGMFEGCTSLTSIGNLETVTSIGSRALIGCLSNLTEFKSDTVTYLGDDAFNGKTKLTSLIIPNCTKLSPNALNAIGEPDLSGKYNYKIIFNAQA